MLQCVVFVVWFCVYVEEVNKPISCTFIVEMHTLMLIFSICTLGGKPFWALYPSTLCYSAFDVYAVRKAQVVPSFSTLNAHFPCHYDNRLFLYKMNI